MRGALVMTVRRAFAASARSVATAIRLDLIRGSRGGEDEPHVGHRRVGSDAPLAARAVEELLPCQAHLADGDANLAAVRRDGKRGSQELVRRLAIDEGPGGPLEG